MMNRVFTIAILMFASLTAGASQHTPLPHGMVFGKKVNPLGKMPAANLEAFMAQKIRISTTLTGTVLKVDTPKGGWFRMDAGKGKVIKVHFKDFNVTLPTDLKGRTVMIEGVAQRQIVADDMQHFAGDTVKKKRNMKARPDNQITFEATGLVVQ